MNTADLKVGDEAYFQAQVRYMNLPDQRSRLLTVVAKCHKLSGHRSWVNPLAG